MPGTAIFLNRGKATAPLALRANVEHNHVLHEHVVILSVEIDAGAARARPPSASRSTTSGYPDDGISHVTARFGYMDPTNVPGLLPLIREAGAERHRAIDDGRPTSCRGSSSSRGHTPGMSRWRKRLFIATSRITADAAEYFQLPRDRTLIVGSRIEL